jgi:class 3 adenylate cyclase/predicted ATPase
MIGAAAMQRIAEWLEKLGMSEYAERFADNAIDFSVLPDLTDQDLEKLGVLLGHRRKMLRAISELDVVSPIRPATSTEPVSQDAAERRQVTVMFSDLVGSTALSARMDPEDLREIISAYQKCVAETVRRFGGFVAKYLGDGVLVYFGYPQAHEVDADRAVRAGLELVTAVNALKTRASLQTRVGIATGLVVVGDLIGTGSAQEQAVVGETPNLAARLQGVAEPNTVVIAESTRNLLGSLFELEDLGAKEVKGLAEPVRAWAALRPSAVESRFEALRSARTLLVGREEEIELLMRRWAQAKAGDGSVVLISGEPGIGKSRIAETTQERLGAEPHTRLRFFCSPHHQDSALYPAIAQLERAAGFRREDTADQRLDKLEALLVQATNDISEVAPLFADLLSIPTGTRYPALTLTPQKRKEKTLAGLVAQVEGLSAREPVLMVFEDVHWSDPTTRESLDLLIDRVPTLRVLLIITFRPEFTPPWVGRPQVTLLSFSRMASRQCAEMIKRVSGGKALPKEIADQIADRTDGVPLFIEELTKAVIESGVLTDAGDRYTVSGPLPPIAIPTSLNASLLARLDRLAPAREVAQIGAALGRQFSHELISAVAPMPQQQVDDALSQLVSAELIFRRGMPPDAEYTFKHALVQDAAYSTLLRSRRQQIHARIVQVLEAQFPAETGSALLAHHCTHAGFVEKAISYRRRAGQQATARSAMVEAVAQLTQGLELLADLPGGAERDGLEIDLQVALGAAFIATKGFAAPEVERAYERARELCRQRADHPQLPTALYGVYLYHLHRSGTHVAADVALELLGLAERRQDTAACAVGHRCLAVSAMHSGSHQLAVTHFEHALTFYDLADRRSPVFLALSDIRVTAINFIPLIMLWRGDLDQAVMRSRTGLAAAHELGHAYTLSHILHLNCWLHQHLGDPTTVRERAEAALNLTAEHGFSLWEQVAVFWRGWALAAAGEFTAALVQMRDAIAILKAMGVVNQMPFKLGLLAGVHTQAGSPTQALALLTEALAIVERTQERWFEAELHRLMAEALLAGSPRDVAEAEASLRRALAVAREQDAKFWELRAAITLARLWLDQGKPSEAVKLLTPVYGSFTEGFDTRDLKEAKKLLDELSS